METAGTNDASILDSPRVTSVTMPRNFWYAAVASSRLGNGPASERILECDLVVFRDASGAPHALLDRCCHRGVPLSLGRVTQGRLACRYHGWEYDGEGRCVHVPSLTSDRRIPEGFGVRAFPCAEKDGYVWVWMGENGRPTEPAPSIPEFARHRWRQGRVAMSCDALKGIENNLDWCHGYFTHPWTHGQFFATRFRGFREQEYEVRLTERGLVVFAPVTASADAPIPERPLAKLAFDFPDRVRVEFWRPFHLTIVLHFVPTGPGTCRLEWLHTRPLPFGWRIAWTDREPRIFRQDRVVMEGARRRSDTAGDDHERSVEADVSTLLARRAISLAAEGRWNDARSVLPQRRIVRVRA